jgi:hypothetical protein
VLIHVPIPEIDRSLRLMRDIFARASAALLNGFELRSDESIRPSHKKSGRSRKLPTRRHANASFHVASVRRPRRSRSNDFGTSRASVDFGWARETGVAFLVPSARMPSASEVSRWHAQKLELTLWMTL